jgi:Metallo-peptidase family M12
VPQGARGEKLMPKGWPHRWLKREGRIVLTIVLLLIVAASTAGVLGIPIEAMPRRDARSGGVYDRMPAMIDAAGEAILNPPHSPIPTPAFRARNSQFRAASIGTPTLAVGIGGKLHVAVRFSKVAVGPRGSTWRGMVQETGETALLMWRADGSLTGVLGYKGNIFTVTDSGGKVHAIPEGMPPEHAPRGVLAAADSGSHHDHPVARPRADNKRAPTSPAPADAKPLTSAERGVLESKKITIDLMVLYTARAARHYLDLPQLIQIAVEEVNLSFVNSGLHNISLRLVHTQLSDYEEKGGEQFEHLYRMVDGVGLFSEVHKLRDEKRADIVGLIVDDPSSCGLSTRVAADAEEAYFVVHHSCAVITYSIAHEIGHIFGARHERTVDASNSPFDFGHGYVNGRKWRDIMSYRESCGGCPRIPYWSNPRIRYAGEPTGTAASDNARVILEQAERVALFR